MAWIIGIIVGIVLLSPFIVWLIDWIWDVLDWITGTDKYIDS